MNPQDFFSHAYSRTNLLRESKTFTDLTIHIHDPQQQISIDVHKILMIFHSPYFAKSLTFGEKFSADSVLLKVTDANATYDVLMSFYGLNTNRGNYSKWKHAVVLLEASRFFLIEVVVPPVPLDSKIPESDYDYFLEFYAETGFDDNSMKVAAENMPDDYNYESLSKEFVQKLIEIEVCPIAIIEKDDKLIVKNILRDATLMEFSGHSHHINTVVISPDNRYIGVVSIEKVSIWDIEGSLVYTIEDSSEPFCSNTICAKFMTKTSCFSVVYNERCIMTHDYIKGKEIYCIDTNSDIGDMAYSPDDSYLVFDSDLCIKIWNSGNSMLTFAQNLYVKHDFMQFINFSPDGKYLIIGHDITMINIYRVGSLEQIIFVSDIVELSINMLYAVTRKDRVNINIWNFETKQLVNTFESYEDDPLDDPLIVFSSDNNYIITRNSTIIYIWNIKTGLLHKSFNNASEVVLSENMKYIAVNDEDKIIIYNFAGNIYKIIEERYAKNIKFINNDRYLIYCHQKHFYKIYDLDHMQNPLEINLEGLHFNDLFTHILPTKLGVKLSKISF